MNGDVPLGILNWCAQAHQGEVFSYYAGHLAEDRFHFSQKGVAALPALRAADEAWSMKEDGYVLLTQQRSVHGFIYNAIRTKKGIAA